MRVAGVPFDQGEHPQGALTPTAVVLHRTYGHWPGDYAVGKHGRDGVGIGFHFLVGQADTKQVQFYDTTVGAAHAKGANSWSVGIEIEGTNTDPLTAWQVASVRHILDAVCAAHGIPKEYAQGGARRRVHGILPHSLVPGSTHTDLVTAADWDRIIGAPSSPGGLAVPPPVQQVPAGEPHPKRPLLKVGSEGEAVRVLQRGLRKVASQAQIKVDGDYGPATKGAVINVQAVCGLARDGICGNDTWGVLDHLSWVHFGAVLT